ncbi:DoxX-like family protein [Flavisolibacter ginsenosidimutans]|uniref:DoxX-like family protein n=1 Tax=Flavisolibacter ginsenosidimutans TaxID=661481 RepID=UPI001D14477C|nr:DoxX-like family protein [Flavisolibacter ginsenosidimutans]
MWTYTQDPSTHQQWDLRFSEITYLPKDNPTSPQRFLYSTKIGFGFKVNGIGESVATKTKDSGESTSVLKFSSDSNLSVIRQGSGYWKYVPEQGGIKFFTGYDYQTRWGIFGQIFDKFIFRPLMVWATAWSFDCLKNWIEKGLHPKQVIKAKLTVVISGIALSLVWIYQGLIPKLLFTDTGEVEILKQSGLFTGNEKSVLTFIGWAEILFGLSILFIHKKFLHIINIFALLLLSATAFFSNAMIFTFPFNPFSLNLSMIAISTIAILNVGCLPKASNSITKQK